jgi:hypothetical protein
MIKIQNIVQRIMKKILKFITMQNKNNKTSIINQKTVNTVLPLKNIENL